ncbi:hypothetical protein B0H12DRAFT_1104707 [Mycena haematopus]|nr:hypothetical protein B0H12DRAFT_1104707 [Mycena haematopus]
MALTLLSAGLLLLACATSAAHAESHTVKFDNSRPQLIKGGVVLTSTSYTSTGDLDAAIASVSSNLSGDCLFNGENCTLLELTMTNPVSVGGGSISLNSAVYLILTRLRFYGGCDGIGTTCNSQSCTTAFRHPDDTWVQIACQENNVNLLISFCPDGPPSSLDSTTTEAKSTAASQTTSKKTSPSTTSSSLVPSSSLKTDSAASHFPTSVPVCTHKHAERRAISAHRKRGSN